ncbi:hypothetical protein LguiB_005399 [Lonicera macranthoides]
MGVFNEFFNNGVVNACTNSTFICLIPKKLSSLKLKDYRPISLVTSLYKILAKVLALRIREVMSETVGLAQVAFVKGRQILDLVLIANESVEEYRGKNKEGVVFKIDFEKAYDHVEWDFIDHVLQNKGFGARWRKWIKGCLSSSNFLVMVNGRPRGIFNASRGIRQGDPLSPFLFVLVADVLNRLVVRAREMGIIDGFEIGRDKIKLSHLQFADDTIFFLSNDVNKLKNLITILDTFGLASGLHINVSKSTLVGINLNEEDMVSLSRVSGCEIGSWPMSYLGMPLGDNPIRVGFWNPVVEKISKRLEGWLKGCLSKGGRLTLIQSVLESIPIYYLSLFKMPISVCNTIEKMMRDFFWEGYGESVGDHLIRWDNVSKSKEKGGLGIGNIAFKNAALLGKWLWRFPNEQNSFWCLIIKSKYGIHVNGWDTNLVTRSTHRNPWKAISSGIEKFKAFIRLKVGMGNSIRFWEDIWVGDSSLASLFPRLYSISRNINSSIASVIRWHHHDFYSWDLEFRRNLHEREIGEFSELLGLIYHSKVSRTVRDSRYWVGEKSGIFSCKSFFHLLINSPQDPIFVPHKFIWKTGIPPKVKIFGWLASWKRVNTGDILQIRRPYLAISSSWCILCKQKGESIDHILLHCNFTGYMWNKVGEVFGSIGAKPSSWRDFLSMEWQFVGNKKKSKLMWRCCCLALAWCIWQERNTRVFEDKSNEAAEIWLKIKLLSSIWATSSSLFVNLSISVICSNLGAAIQ